MKNVLADFDPFAEFQEDLPYSDVVETVPQPVEQRVERNDDIFVAQMSEVERRLVKATLYREFLNGSMFDSPDQTAREVEAEVREFIKVRLGVLLGMAAEAAPTSEVFTPLEVTALKALAARVTGSAKLANAVGAPPPAAKPRPAPPAPRPRPTLRRRKVPEEVRAAPLAAPAVAATPVVTKPVAPVAPVAPVVAAPPPKGGVPADESMVREGDAIYQIKWERMNPGEYGQMLENKLMSVPPGRAVTLPNNIQVLRRSEDEFFKIRRHLRRDPSKVPQVGGAKWGSNEQMARIIEDRANAAAAMSERKQVLVQSGQGEKFNDVTDLTSYINR